MKIRNSILLWFCVVFISISACRKDKGPEDAVEKSISLNLPGSWSLSSTPLLFPESGLWNDVRYGMNRAMLSWYIVDASIFYDPNGSRRPSNITKEDMSKDECRVIYMTELFPDTKIHDNHLYHLPTLNIDYYPAERGPWNYSVNVGELSAGISENGILNAKETRWGGIIREIPEISIQADYLDFWLLNPFSSFPSAQGDLYIDIGEISEDVLKDGRLSAEHTIEGVEAETAWGYIKQLTEQLNFSNTTFGKQDVGLDEMNSASEPAYFQSYLIQLQQHCSSEYYQSVLQDVTGDDYHSYLGEDYDALNYKVRERYKRYNGQEYNSFIDQDLISSRSPNSEDINRNGRLDTINYYSEFRIRLSSEMMVIGENYLVDIYQENPFDILKENGRRPNSTFYHFRIPLKEASPVNGISFAAVNPKYLRLFLTGFQSEINLRFITLELLEEIRK